MLLNFLKIAIRNIYKKSTFSLLNILGLTLGLTAFFLIFRYVLFELSYDGFHKNASEVYSLALVNEKETGQNTYHQIPVPFKNSIENIPEIATVVRFNNIDYQNNSIIFESEGEKKVFEERGMYFVEPEFEKIFDFTLKKGEMSKMAEPFKIILSDKAASKLFGETDPIGKVVNISGNVGAFNYEVVGVLNNLPVNSSIQFGALLSYKSARILYNEETEENWERWSEFYFVKKTVNTEKAQLEKKIEETLEVTPEIAERKGTWSVEMTPIKDLYLHTENHPILSKNGNLETIWVLSLVGLFTLLIAYINYINLSTARSMERAREVGVRKVMGSSVELLRYQFLSEAFLLNIVAFVISLVIVQWAIPFFQEISNPLLIVEENQWIFWSVSAFVVIIGSILSGLYPAFVLSSYKPITVVNGKVERAGKGAFFRKALVVFQYASSITLLAGALTVQKQIAYMQEKDLGIDLEKLVVLDAPPGALNGNNGEFFKTLNHFKSELEAYPAIESITTANAVPGKGINWGSSMARQGAENKHSVSLIACDKDYAKTFGIEVLAGRFYNDSDDSFRNGNVVINEKAARLMGFENPAEAVGKRIKGGNMFPNLIVEGVMKNHHHGSLHEEYTPIAYIKSVWSNYYAVKLAKNENADTQHTLDLIRKEWEEAFEGAPFEYFFAEDSFDAQYASDRHFLKIINIFTILAVIIASLGLLGLFSYNMLQRRKEMGIRKILGASSKGLLVLVSKDYFILLIIASVIATPLAWFLMDLWLNNYAFRIDLGLWLALIPVSIIVLIAFSTISLQVFKTVNTNPVESLRQE